MFANLVQSREIFLQVRAAHGGVPNARAHHEPEQLCRVSDGLWVWRRLGNAPCVAAACNACTRARQHRNDNDVLRRRALQPQAFHATAATIHATRQRQRRANHAPFIQARAHNSRNATAATACNIHPIPTLTHSCNAAATAHLT